MHSFTIREWVLLTAIIFTVASCQGNPASPGISPESPGPQVQTAESGQAHHLYGCYSFIVDTENYTIEVLPVRSQELHLNVTGILNTTMGVSAAGVPAESDHANGLFVFDVTLKHPFSTKPQLAGFDVKGILIAPGTKAIGTLMFSDVDETRLENADGYTRWWNPTEFTSPGIFGYTQGNLANAPGSMLTATVNPYKYFADSLWADSAMTLVYSEPMDGDKGRGVFTAGKSNTRRYRIRFPMNPGPKVTYGYAVDAAWAAPSPNPPGQVPDDFSIEANQPEAYYVKAQETVNTLYYDSETGYSGGVLRLQINVHDWQGQLEGNIHNQIGDVRIYSPCLFSGGVDATYLNEINIKAYYTADLTGTAAPIASGRTLLAVSASSNGDPGYDQGVGPAPSGDISAWDALVVTVQDPDCIADANNDFADALETGFGEFVTDQLCVPDDIKDYYYFEIPSGYVALGDVSFWCDATTGKLELYDSNQALITETMLSGGHATIHLDNFELMPGKYYLRVYSYDSTHPTPYLLENTARMKNVAPSNVVDITPDGLFLDAEDMILDGDYLYLTGYYGFWIYDVSDPSAPVLVSKLDEPIGNRMAKYGNYIYSIAYPEVNKAQLDMLDVTDPYAPVHHAQVVYWGYQVTAICMNSEHIFVASDDPGPNTTVVLYEYASNPLLPGYDGSFSTTYGSPGQLDLIDPEGPATILVIRHGTRIASYTVEDLSNVLKVGDYSCTSAKSIDVVGNYVFVSGVGMGVVGGLFILMQTQIQGLVEVGAVETPGDAWDVDIEGNYAVIADGVFGMSVCDISNLASPAYVTNVFLVADGRKVDAYGTLACVITDDAGFELIDFSTPATPVVQYLTIVVNSATSVHMVDDYLVVSDSGTTHWAVITVDISDPAEAHVVSEYILDVVKPDLMVLGPDGIGAAAGNKLWTIIDASDPMNVTNLVNGSVLNKIDALGLNGDALYIADDTDMTIFDIDPLPPVWKGTFTLPDHCYAFSFTDNYMYLSIDDIEIYSTINPYNPSYVGTYTVPERAIETVVRGDYLYITEIDRLEIADISSPGSPTWVGAEMMTSSPMIEFAIVLDGQFAYLAGVAPVSACNVWPPDDPTFYGDIIEPRVVNDLLVNDGILYTAGDNDGIGIFDLY